MAMNNGNGDSVVKLIFDYHGWAGSIEIPHISAANLPTKLETIVSTLEAIGAKPAHAPTSNAAPAAATASNEPPICEYHGPMKASTKAPGTWYCPQKMGDGSYCKSKA